MANNHHKHSLEFLPAALEIQETPPSPLGRAIVWSLMLFFTVAVVWAFIGKIDIVATAQGKIIPSGRVKVIQPLEIGVVRKIHVIEGQHVEQGTVLIELDPTTSGADRKHLADDLMAAKLDVARLRAFLQFLANQENSKPLSSFAVPEGSEPRLVIIQQQLLQNQLQEREARLAGLDSEISRYKANLAATHDTVKKLEGTLPLVAQRAEAMRVMAERGLGPKMDHLALEQQRIEQQQDLASQRNRLKEAQAAITQSQQQRRVTDAELQHTALMELAEAEKKGNNITQELIKAEQRQVLERLVAPTSGVVQQLAVHTVGGVVTPAQPLMVIVPIENNLEVEAWLENKDIGFVHNKQKAEVKIETFPFTKYGTIDAQITNISNDAISDEKRGLIYAARVLLKKSVIPVEGKLVNLTPGMAVTVEIKTGQRRLIEYFLSPLLRYKQESIRER